MAASPVWLAFEVAYPLPNRYGRGLPRGGTNAGERDPRIRARLEQAHTIAVVGLSDKPERDSHRIARYLQLHGYRIVPVNPMLSSALGERAYPSLSAIPPEIPIDIVDIFRRSEEVPPIVDEALARKVPTIWMQLGVEHPAAAAKARAAGALVLENQCIMVTHRELGIPRRTGSS